MGKSSRRSPYYRETYRSKNGKRKRKSYGLKATGEIPFEKDGVNLSNARQTATLAVYKPCSSTKFVQWS
ncbi:60S ribosomal protein L16, putative [Ricinus communis]|uniref:60S ribosomal protein L16, putative n=1 Tax=Ricinus communis TaxID=3988 RepID=B9T141_RICCO|nr:60S ribosomal protein L16, putative [Ricinus communis]